jgi:hypothetical protein
VEKYSSPNTVPVESTENEEIAQGNSIRRHDIVFIHMGVWFETNMEHPDVHGDAVYKHGPSVSVVPLVRPNSAY